jgi:hypothetical protein
MMKQALSVVGVASLLWSSGCMDLNSRSTIGADRALPALEAASPATPDEVRATRLDRADWAPIEYRVPVDGTVHAPLWRSRVAFSDEQRRQHGLYPTAESSLDLGAPADEEAVRGFVEPVRALADVFLMPVYWVIDPVWDLEQSPSMYKRWHSGEWLAGPLPESGGDEPAGDAGGDS